jgi:hypothetical protein
LPPDVASKWDDCSVWVKAQLIAYNQIRDYEIAEYEHKKLENMLKAVAR